MRPFESHARSQDARDARTRALRFCGEVPPAGRGHPGGRLPAHLSAYLNRWFLLKMIATSTLRTIASARGNTQGHPWNGRSTFMP
jgi:hypothetical protein